MNKKYLVLAILILAILGLCDSIYLTYEHFSPTITPCTPGSLLDCGSVLTSKYSEIFGIPLALLGAFHYSLLTALSALIITRGKKNAKYFVLILTAFGFIFSAYLVYLQLVVIGAICAFCMASATISILAFVAAQFAFNSEAKSLCVGMINYLYKYLARVILFQIDSELIHEQMLSLGEKLGQISIAKSANKYLFRHENPVLSQKIAGINFANPVGLAAGFDYETKLTQILPSLGFGFETVGTITNKSYEGNPKPRLGRLPKSRSLMVNKGFKNQGAKKIIKKLEKLSFEFPVGVSIGATNSPNIDTQEKAVADIISAFSLFEKSKAKHSYYELNISCPNLIHGEKISFYPPKKLDALLSEIDKLKLKKPLFVKMPIEKNNKEVLGMLRVIAKHAPAGVIFGNLQKDKNHPSLDKQEVKKFKVGYFSGKPTWRRSNELIKLAYKNYKGKLVIIGCGGIFSAQDAYKKIKLGANMLQFITGMIYEGPQLATQINLGLGKLLEKDGYTHIGQAVGKGKLIL